MSETEAILWTVEKDPSLRSDFLNITLLDRPPHHDRLRAKVAGAIDELPRLRQRVVTPPLRLAPPEWVDDPQFDLDYHVRRMAVPEPGTLRQLLDLAATLSAQPFDRARPLWDLTLIEGLEGGRAALLQKIHHTIIDGVGGVKFSMALLDLERDPGDVTLPGGAAPDDDRAPDEDRTRPLDVLLDSVAWAATRQLDRARDAAEVVERTLRQPASLAEAPRRLAALAGSLREQVFVAGEARSPIMRERSLRRRFDVFSLPLDGTKAAAKALGGTVNDVYVTGIAGGLGLYHERMGEPVEELRMAMPVNLRGDDEGFSGNRFAPARIIVPVVPKDARDRFAAVKECLSGIRQEPALNVVDQLAGFVGLLPTSVVVPVTRAQTRTIDFVASNVRGAPFDLYLAGSRVEANHPMGPCAGAALNVTTLSYRGSLDIGVHSDTAAVTDPEELLDCLQESFDALLGAASGGA